MLKPNNLRIFQTILILSVHLNLLMAGRLVVSNSGDDKNPGTLNKPLASIQKAFDNIRPGDTIFIRNGVYPISTGLRTRISGTRDHWITCMAYPGDTVWIDATAYRNDSNGRPLRGHRMAALQIEGVSYNRFINIGVRNSHTVGIVVNGPLVRSVELIGCKSEYSYGSGISVWYADSVKVLNCEITGSNNPEMYSQGAPMRREAPHEALSVCGATHFEIAWNHIHNCQKEGIDCKEVSAHGIIHHNHVHDMKRQGLYVDCWFGLLEDVDIFGNEVHDCEVATAISGEGKGAEMRNIRFHHNVIYRNRASGFAFGVWGSNGPRKDIYIYNNTFWKNGSPKHWHGPTGGIDVRSSNIENIYIYNNICFDNYSYEIATFDEMANSTGMLDKKCILITHNLTGSFKYIPDSSRIGFFNNVYAYSGLDCQEGDPLFINPERGDFGLKRGSPAIGKGWKDAPFYSKDMGAIEYRNSHKTKK